MLKRQEATELVMKRQSTKCCFDDGVDVRRPICDCHVGVYIKGREM
jgi:hypothetical protein